MNLAGSSYRLRKTSYLNAFRKIASANEDQPQGASTLKRSPNERFHLRMNSHSHPSSTPRQSNNSAEKSGKEKPTYTGWGTWIRTKTNRVRVCCATVTPFPNGFRRSEGMKPRSGIGRLRHRLNGAPSSPSALPNARASRGYRCNSSRHCGSMVLTARGSG